MSDKEYTFKDINLICKDCGERFVFSAAEQSFFAKQGFTNAPARCKKCREELQKKKYKGAELYNVKCKICGRVGKILAKPTHPKEVLCSNCFDQLFSQEKEKRPIPTTLEEAAARL